mmetsp:Transcript_23119/g.50074  ORF Transcript_23119/g.50074 Transcript_23119/m.50074 type:complete len:81 (-) Transcript_23119:606-848(-)
MPFWHLSSDTLYDAVEAYHVVIPELFSNPFDVHIESSTKSPLHITIAPTPNAGPPTPLAQFKMTKDDDAQSAAHWNPMLV